LCLGHFIVKYLKFSAQQLHKNCIKDGNEWKIFSIQLEV